jgi:hypothetical protein
MSTGHPHCTLGSSTNDVISLAVDVDNSKNKAGVSDRSAP